MAVTLVSLLRACHFNDAQKHLADTEALCDLQP